MMKCVQEVLEEKGGNYILPFLWLHGEDTNCILEEINQIYDCGISAFCVESRPHPDFLGEYWWKQMDAILEKAREKGMKVWLLDDQHFPTGYSAGAYIQNPEKAKVYVREFHMDLRGPASNITVFIEKALKEPERILAVWLYRRDFEDSGVDADTAVNITEKYCHGRVQLSVGSGNYRLFVYYTSRTGGGHEHYMNLLDAESVRVLIDTVYEPHYKRYRDYFGSTFAGFFSDEPEIGNTPGCDYNQLPGQQNQVYPWSDSLEKELQCVWGKDYSKYLAVLWFDLEKETAEMRYSYMNAVTKQIREHFSMQIGSWCRERGVEYIGHIIEDNNAHGRLGCSTGHYFRSLEGQDMSGIDIVSGQLMPGFTETAHRWLAGEEDGEFFHFGLAKLAASAAAVDVKKKGRAMCELFGAYGWGEGISLMKWLTDHMLVRGINQFVPHAFSPVFPDDDCPPHFYAQGNNPQYELFGKLMRYVNRAAHLLHGGVRWTEAAVLYHAEAEWTGTDTMLYQKPVRKLLENQLDCTIIPADKLHEVCIQDRRMQLAGYCYEVFIIPGCERIPENVEEFVINAGRRGLPVFVTGKLPQKDVTGKRLTDEFYQYVRYVPLSDLAKEVKKWCSCSFDVKEKVKDLRTCRYLHEDGSVCMFFNESTQEKVRTAVTVHGMKKNGWKRYRAMTNTMEELPCSMTACKPVIKGKKSGELYLNLEPGEAVFITEADLNLEPAKTIGIDIGISGKDEIWEIPLDIDWTVSKCEGDPEFRECLYIKKGEPYPNLNDEKQFPDYSGVFRYEGTFYLNRNIPKEASVVLHFPEISEGAQIWMNGEYAGDLLENGHYMEIGTLIQNGENHIRIEISNTLVWQLKDRRSAYMQILPTGIMQIPLIKVCN